VKRKTGTAAHRIPGARLKYVKPLSPEQAVSPGFAWLRCNGHQELSITEV